MIFREIELSEINKVDKNDFIKIKYSDKSELLNFFKSGDYNLYIPSIFFNKLDNLYVEEFASKLVIDNYIIYHDYKQSDKKMHNYIYLEEYSKKDIDWYYNYALKNKYETICYFIKDYLDTLDFNEYDVDILNIGYFASDINELNIIPNVQANVVKMTNENEIDFFIVMYLECLKYGDNYAKINANRYKEVILNNDSKIAYYFVYKGNKPIGFLSVLEYEDIIKIEDFCILKLYRNQGYGKTLFKEVIDIYKNKKYVYLAADLDDTVISMYENWGFKKIGKSYFVILNEKL